MKKGSGNLDFGGNEDEPDDDSESEPLVADSNDEITSQSQSSTADRDDTNTNSEPESTTTSTSDVQEFPYFVRRSNVLDERDKRIEAHLREEVTNQESEFRNALADVLETNEVAKSDAREFALKFAFENPEGVAELMREEGYGLTD